MFPGADRIDSRDSLGGLGSFRSGRRVGVDLKCVDNGFDLRLELLLILLQVNKFKREGTRDGTNQQ